MSDFQRSTNNQWPTRKNLPAGSSGNTLSSTKVEIGSSSGSRVTTRASPTKCDSSPVARPFKGTSRSRAPLIRTIPSMNPTSKNAKQIIWRKRFGVRGLFAFSGSSKAGPVPYATPKSPGSRVGAYHCVPRALGGSTSADNRVLLPPECHDRVHRQRLSVSKPSLPAEAFEGPEPDDGKLSGPVLRGLAPSNGASYSVKHSIRADQ